MLLGTFVVRVLQEKDIQSLLHILIENVHAAGDLSTIYYDEIEQIIGYMRGERDSYGRERTFLVAEDSTGFILGCMAYSWPEPDMMHRFPELTSINAVEILNAFVSLRAQRRGVGQRLVAEIEKRAKNAGRDFICVSSGPRYKDSGGHGLYTKLFGEPKGYLLHKYGKDRHATIWIARL